MTRLTDEQRRVLKYLRRHPRSCAKDMRTGIRTLMALNRLGLIYVATTFDSIAFPQKAPAELTQQGLFVLQDKRQ